MSTLAYALEALCKYAESETVDRRPKDKHGPVGRRPVARIDVADLRGLMTLHGDPPTADREALAAAAHKYYCLRRDEPIHEPDQHDYDKADEILEILALVLS